MTSASRSGNETAVQKLQSHLYEIRNSHPTPVRKKRPRTESKGRRYASTASGRLGNGHQRSEMEKSEGGYLMEDRKSYIRGQDETAFRVRVPATGLGNADAKTTASSDQQSTSSVSSKLRRYDHAGRRRCTVFQASQRLKTASTRWISTTTTGKNARTPE